MDAPKFADILSMKTSDPQFENSVVIKHTGLFGYTMFGIVMLMLI